MIYVDTNYWIYWLDERLPEHEFVVKSMRSCIGEGIVINYVTLMEICHYLRHLNQDEFRNAVDMIKHLSTLKLVDLDGAIADLAMELLIKHGSGGIGGRDSVVLATMKSNNVKRILTHDRAFKRIKGIKVIDTIPHLRA